MKDELIRIARCVSLVTGDPFRDVVSGNPAERLSSMIFHEIAGMVLSDAMMELGAVKKCPIPGVQPWMEPGYTEAKRSVYELIRSNRCVP